MLHICGVAYKMLGDPVIGTEFVDREIQLELLIRRLDNFKKGERRNIAIIGLRKIGKSSLLQQFISQISGDTSILPVLVYLPERNTKAFIKKTVGAVFYEYLKKKGIRDLIQFSVEQIVRLAIKHNAPQSGAFSLDILGLVQQDLNEAFDKLLKLPSVMKQETGSSIILIFDEFQRIVDYKLEAPIDTFRENVMYDKGTWYIISGSSISMLNKIVASSDSPLFVHFEQLRLREFDYENAKLLIRKRLGNLAMSDYDISFLVYITNGIPYYLDVLCFTLKELVIKKGTGKIDKSALIEAVTSELAWVTGSIYSYLNSLVEGSIMRRGFENYVEILNSIALGNNRLAQIAKETGMRLTDLPRYLKNLIELDILERKDDVSEPYPLYYFIDPLLELWLRDVYLLTEESYIAEIEIKRKAFRSKLTEMLDSYKQELGKGNEARIRELFTLFDGNKRFRNKVLPKFASVTSETIDNEEFDIVAKKNGFYWFVEVTATPVNKNEIEKFLKKLEKVSGYVIENKIFICLAGIEDPALELCEQSNIIVWTLEEVNSLLKAHHRFRILS